MYFHLGNQKLLQQEAPRIIHLNPSKLQEVPWTKWQTNLLWLMLKELQNQLRRSHRRNVTKMWRFHHLQLQLEARQALLGNPRQGTWILNQLQQVSFCSISTMQEPLIRGVHLAEVVLTQRKWLREKSSYRSMVSLLKTKRHWGPITMMQRVQALKNMLLNSDRRWIIAHSLGRLSRHSLLCDREHALSCRVNWMPSLLMRIRACRLRLLWCELGSLQTLACCVKSKGLQPSRRRESLELRYPIVLCCKECESNRAN